MSNIWNGDHPTGGKGVRLLKSQPGQCKWPLGKYREVATRYCGEPISPKSKVYCECHRQRGRTPFRVATKS